MKYSLKNITHLSIGQPLIPGPGFLFSDGKIQNCSVTVGFDDGLLVNAESVPMAVEKANKANPFEPRDF